MPAVTPTNRCPDCRGRGSILLLVREVPCKRCEGRGYLLTSPLDLAVDDLRIPERSRDALKRLKVATVRDITRLSEDDLSRDPAMTRSTVDELKRALAIFGIGLKKKT